MTGTAPPGGRDGPHRPALGTVLAGLCVTEIVSWGVLYYAFPVLAPRIVADTGWSNASITAAFSAGLVVAAVVGIPVGRMLDRRGPHVLMTAGSVLAVLALVLIARATSFGAFAVGWIVAGLAMAGVLYPPAFAALTRWYGPRRLLALTAVTLIAGLASTVFAPLTELLAVRWDWRETYLSLAVGLAVVTVPVHAVVLRRPWPAEPMVTPVGQEGDTPGAVGAREATPGVASSDAGYAQGVVRSRPFVLLTVGMTAGVLAMFAALINLVPLLAERGASSSLAAIALGAGGIGQVAGRLGYAALNRRLGVRPRTLVVYGVIPVTTAAFVLGPNHAAWLLFVAIAAGVGRGIATLLQATAVTDRWGPRAYGRISGVLSAPIMAASALAPWLGAGGAELLGSYAAMYLALAALGVLAVVLLAFSVPEAPARRWL